MKKTSFRVTKATLELENALIQKMDIHVLHFIDG